MKQELLELIDPVIVELCQGLPFGATILTDEKHCCKKDNPNCPYNRKDLNSDFPLCYKKTTTGLPLARSLI